VQLTNAEAWAKPWACGVADANCRARSQLAAVGASVVYDITVADGNVNDMIVIANSTDGHVDLLVTPPADDAAVHTMLRGPWRSAGFAGPESIVVPAAALAPGRYTVQLTATQPFTTFTLQVMRDQDHRRVDTAQQVAVQKILEACCGAAGCTPYKQWQTLANTTTLCMYPGNLCSGEALISLNLSGQGLQCQLATDLLGNFYALERLDLSHNALDIDFGRLPFATQQLRSLAAMDLSYNNATGALICDNINPTLLTLDLSHNGLSGSIPSCVGSASALQLLRLGGNALTGGLLPLPPNSQLRVLNMTGNRMDGGVGSLAGAGQLTEVDLSNNKLTGALPALPAALQMANMSGNAFAGGIPTSYGFLKALETLNVSHNELTAPLPASLAAAPLLTTLDASHNSMGGTLGQYAAALPTSGGAATTLLLDHNELSGSVPKQLGRLAAVKTGGALSLGVNELNGPFPEWLLTSNATADGSLSLALQVNRFTCPTAYMKLPAPVPSNVTDGLICYTGTPNAMPVGATASLAAYTPHNVTDYLDAKKAAKLLPGGKHATAGGGNSTESASSSKGGGGGSGTNKGLAITLPLLFILLLVAGAIGGWFWWSRRRVAAAQDVLPYDPETNLWKRGPGGSMYHSPPVAAKDGGFAGALKRKAHAASPLSAHTAAPAGAMATVDLAADDDAASDSSKIAAVPASPRWLSAATSKPAEPSTPAAGRFGALRAALGFGTAAAASPTVGTSYQPAQRPTTTVSVRAGGPIMPAVHGSAAAALPPAPHPTPASTAAAAPGAASWGPLGAGVSRAITWAGAGGSGSALGGGGSTLARLPTTPHSPRHRGGPAAEASWHRVALHTATEERQRAGQAEQGDEEEPRTPSFAHGLSAHARRRSPV
jgi:hypothetical protein